MRRPVKLALLAAATLLLATSVAGDPRPAGYLQPGEFSVTGVIEPPPVRGDPRDTADRAIFRATRPLLAGPRGALATRDVDTSAPALLRDFSCAVGVTLTPTDAPRLLALVQRAGADTGAQTNDAKNYFKRLRPYRFDSGPICQPRAEVDQSYDYPSGHTTWGWTWALILANLAPDRARQILLRGRGYGDSRYICGVHYESAVEAGFLSASATLAVVASKPAYRSDLEAARAELAALRAHPAAAAPADCEAEAALLAGRPLVDAGGGPGR